MLRTRSGLPRSMATWASQVAASVGATLVALLIYAALPKPVPSDASAPRPELTSGGKFAARAVVPLAYDGLDAMPLPRVTAVALQAAAEAAPAETPTAAASLRRVVWDGSAPLVLAPDRPARTARSAHAPIRSEPRRAATAEPRAAAAPSVAPSGDDRGDETESEIGFVPRVLPQILPTIVSGARDVWAVTASAGGSLVSRVVPQIP